MKYRKLRIAWSVAWGVVAVLLCVLWVRSQNRQDRLIRHSSFGIEFRSYNGQTILEVNPSLNPPTVAFWEFKTRLADHVWYPPHPVIPFFGRLGIDWGIHNGTQFLFLPHWMLVALPLVCVSLVWADRFPWRFSLRTLLIATTLVAVVLGAVVYAMR